jgi:hypothetical protein
VKGATELEAEVIGIETGFNPRTREGCDRTLYFSSEAQGGFNPRTREGCDRFNPSGR